MIYTSETDIYKGIGVCPEFCVSVSSVLGCPLPKAEESS